MIDQLFFTYFFVFITFLMVIIMNVVKKNTIRVYAYFFQSLALVMLLSIQSFQQKSIELFIVTMVLFVVKTVAAPIMFMRIVRRSKLNISTSTFLNVPMTLGVLVLLCLFANSEVFSPLRVLLSQWSNISVFLIGGIFMSFFLTFNKKSALSQLIGVLSLENCIFVISRFLNIHELLFLEIGLLFDVLFWIIVGSIFATMIYKHYGTFDITRMQALKK